MTRQKTGSRLDSKLKAAEALQAEIKELKAAARRRKKETADLRCKVVGREILDHATANPASRLTHDLLKLLGERLTKPSERALFPELNLQSGIATPPPSETEAMATVADEPDA